MDTEEMLLVHHPWFDAGLETLAECYKSVGTTVEPQCRAFVGPSGSGKSTLAASFAAQHPTVDRKNHLETPVLFLEVPSAPTVSSFSETILYKLGDPLWNRGNVNAKSIRFRTICKECKVRMVAMDDFQHFVDYHRNVPKEVAEWLKTQIILTKISFTAFGLERCVEVFRQNEQLRRRFGAPVRVGAFRWSKKEEREQFRSFLLSLKKGLVDFSMPEMNIDFCFRMHYASYGLIGYTMKIIRAAVKMARRRHTSEITLEMFARSFSQGVWDDDSTGPNPFSNEFNPQKSEPDRILPVAKEPDPPIKSRRRKSRLHLIA
jgi:energy-coupling factor transporter ATP-binding protein EcfA2